MEPKFFNIPVCVGDVTLRVAQGHFATRNSHTNYFIDVTRQQSCLQIKPPDFSQDVSQLFVSVLVNNGIYLLALTAQGTVLLGIAGVPRQILGVEEGYHRRTADLL